MQNYCLKYAKQVEITKTNKKNLSLNSCKFLFVIFLVLIVYFVVVFLLILQSDAIFVLSGTKNDITGQKTISRDISFLCHRVIALIKAQVCDKCEKLNILKEKDNCLLNKRSEIISACQHKNRFQVKSLNKERNACYFNDNTPTFP